MKSAAMSCYARFQLRHSSTRALGVLHSSSIHHCRFSSAASAAAVTTASPRVGSYPYRHRVAALGHGGRQHAAVPTDEPHGDEVRYLFLQHMHPASDSHQGSTPTAEVNTSAATTEPEATNATGTEATSANGTRAATATEAEVAASTGTEAATTTETEGTACTTTATAASHNYDHRVAALGTPLDLSLMSPQPVISPRPRKTSKPHTRTSKSNSDDGESHLAEDQQEDVLFRAIDQREFSVKYVSATEGN